jgi:hypothetical protein
VKERIDVILVLLSFIPILIALHKLGKWSDRRMERRRMERGEWVAPRPRPPKPPPRRGEDVIIVDIDGTKRRTQW